MKYTYNISSDYPNKKEFKELLAGNDLADAIVTFIECIINHPEHIFSLTYNGLLKETYDLDIC